mmetsp:Transcript_16761/g.19104  ORF Transcript_16761/g.19104 Transcript_16761/m.19104 type:complete len:1470 (-) Transcript_16761:116-4525(-)
MVVVNKIICDEKTEDDVEIAKQLFSSLLYMKDASGRTYLHTDFKLSWAKALLDRAKSLDDGVGAGQILFTDQHKTSRNRNNNGMNNTLMQRRFLLQPDRESGYTPFHRAIMERNLAAVLLFLRHAMDTTSTERLTQRPMTVLHAAEANNNHNHSTRSTYNPNNNNNNSNTLLLAMASATDHEGMMPLRLLGQLQQSELLRCRNYLSSFQPAVDRNATMMLRNRRRHSSFDDGGDGNNNNSNDSENDGLLRIDSDLEDDNDDDDDSESTYACEVVSWGRPHHCALGVVQGGSSFSSSSSSSTFTSSSNKDINHRYTHGSAFCPQRIQEFAQEIVGRQGSAIAVAAATYHTLVVTKKGQLYSFGLEKCGRLGLGDQQTQQCPLPKRVLGALQRRKVVSAAVAENHSLCVTSIGEVFSWGSNRFGQLGDVTENASAIQCGSRSLPRRVEDLKQYPCVAVAAGEKHSVALSRKGEIYVWGDNTSGQLGVSRQSGIQKVQRVEAFWATSTTHGNSPKIAIAIAAAEQSTLALTIGSPSTGLAHINNIYEWGHGNHVPIRVHFDVTSAINNGNQSETFSSRFHRIANPTAIACARYHNAAITSDGLVYTWGLRAESLGRGNSNKTPKQPQQQRRNSFPQLVTGMLSERGGGLAVAIAASGSHTAVVCGNGALFTWGTTDEDNVLGHEGVRWQPNPKRVPGVHRAVDVAVAKEHTVLLLGATFPKMKKMKTLSSLENFAACKVAEYVDLFNVIPIMIMAERTECSFLISYCTDFIHRNFDGVLNVGKKSDMNQYLNDMLAETTHRAGKRFHDDHHHPFIFDVLAAGNIGRPTFDHEWFSTIEGWSQGCKLLSESPITQRLLALVSVREYEEDARGLKPKARSRSSCQKEVHAYNQKTRSTSTGQDLSKETITKEGHLDRCIKKIANMDLSTIERVNENSVWLSREIRGVRKKLKQICNLLDIETQNFSLSVEQIAKVNRRPALETESSIYESAAEVIKKRLKEFENENRKEKIRLHQDKTNVQNDSIDDDDEEEEYRSKIIGKSKKDEEEFESCFCNVCGVKCSDKRNLFLHLNGRKHRNRVAQASEEEQERAAVSIRQQQQIEQMKSAPLFTPPSKKNIKNAWGAPSSQPHYKLPPPPHPVVEPLSSPQNNPIPLISNLNKMLKNEESAMMKKKLPRATTKYSEVLSKNVSPSSCRNKPPFPSDSNFTQILKKQEMGKKKKKSSVATKKSSVPLYINAVGNSAQAYTPNKAQNSQRSTSVSLADFLTPSREKQTSSLSHSPVTATSPWLKNECTVNEVQKTTPIPTNFSKSISQIQAEEADLKGKQDKSYGKGGGSWYVERRKRAESVLEIQKNTKENSEYRLLVEEQMKIEAQIREENKRKHKTKQAKKKVDSNGINIRGGSSKRRNNKKVQNNNKDKSILKSDNNSISNHENSGGNKKAYNVPKTNRKNEQRQEQTLEIETTAAKKMKEKLQF